MRESKRYLRFPLSYRLEHWLLILSFTILAVSGLAQKFATVGLSQWIIARLAGIEMVRIIHRIAAIVLMLGSVYHLGVSAYRVLVNRSRLTMVPTLDDARAGLGWFKYNLGLSDTKPQEGRFTFAEKFEYWGLIWGTTLMVITGFLLWNPIASTRFLPGEWIPAAKAAHGGEAILAVLTIIVWHMYHVHVRSFNKSMFTGYLSEEEMLHEHPLELADIQAGIADRAVDPAGVARRRKLFIPAFTIISVVFLVGIVFFATFEETAITTLPPAEDVIVYAPLTPTPLPTALPTKPPSSDAPFSWDAGFGELFSERCGTCHNQSTGLGGLDTSSFAALLAGGNAGAGIVPGDATASTVVTRQSEGNHPGQLSGEELAWLIEWIESGAPEN